MTTEEVGGAEYQHVVIFLHGVGGSGSEWKRFLQKILPPRTKLILPSAPVAPVDLFFGREMSSWYNMYDSYTSNILEVKRMAELFHQLIQDEVDKGVRPECIVLGGFSQGEWCVCVPVCVPCQLSPLSPPCRRGSRSLRLSHCAPQLGGNLRAVQLPSGSLGVTRQIHHSE